VFAQAPERWESARCFYEAGRSSRSWEAAARRLDALAERHADRPWLLLARAYVEEERDARHAAGRYRAAIAAFAARGHIEGEVRARCAFADWLSAQGESREAGTQLDLAARHAEAAGARGPLGEALIFQARHLHSRSDLQEAYRLALRAERDLFPGGAASPQMLCLELLAGLERDLGRRDRSVRDFRRLEQLAQANGRRNLVARAQFGISLLLFDELDRAPRPSGRPRIEAQLRQALATAEEVGDQPAQAWIHAVLANLLGSPEAQEHLDQCLQLTRDHKDLLAYCLQARSRFQAETDPAAAERSLEEARTLAERSGDLQTLAGFWYDRMNFTWRQGQRGQALADSAASLLAVEALRDRQLEEAGRAGLFSRWLAPYYAVSGHLLESFQHSGDPAELDRAFAVTESMRGRVLRELLAGPRDPDPPPSFWKVADALQPEEALLSFQIAPRQDLFGYAGGSWLLVITNEGTAIYRLPESVDRAPLETTVAAFLGLIERRDGSENDLAAVLYEQLLGKALSDLSSQVRRLVIVPDGILHRLPFAALRPRRDGPPLVDRFQISVVPSATLWTRWRGQPRRATRAALVLADATLPGARREGRHVLRRCGKGSVLQAGPEAGEAFLKRQDLSRFGVLHLAAHAESDDASPEASAVLLAADASGEDGRLEVDEITKLNLRGSLVALSSCRSASGALLEGEGVMSLSRAFFAAGSAVVVGSLWPVRDGDAEAFFEIFYDHLADGETASAAFSAAQRERLRDGAPAEAWAGFVLAGDGAWRLPPGPHNDSLSWPVVVAILGGLLALGAAVFLIRRKSA
jgi:CHAT domain-containing protein